jgi:hypothetical protein
LAERCKPGQNNGSFGLLPVHQAPLDRPVDALAQKDNARDCLTGVLVGFAGIALLLSPGDPARNLIEPFLH